MDHIAWDEQIMERLETERRWRKRAVVLVKRIRRSRWLDTMSPSKSVPIAIDKLLADQPKENLSS